MTWVCLRVQLRQERRVLLLLQEAGVLSYTPLETRKVVVKHPHRPGIRRSVPRVRALLPGYVFASLPDDNAIDTARSIRLVRDIMADPLGKPKTVDLAKLRGLLLADMFRLFDETYEPPKRKGYTPRWKAGQRVKGQRGSNVEGWFGEVIGTKGRQQIEVMFTRYGRSIPVFVDDGDLMEAADSPMRLEAA